MIAFGACCVALAMAIPYPDHGLGHEPHGKPHIPVGPKGYGKDQYFQYINVPAHKVFEWGYRRGIDPHHFREEYLSQKDHTFKAKVSSNVAAALVRTQGPSEMDRTFYSRSTLSLLIVWQDQFLFQAAHTGPSPNVKQDLM